MENAISKRYLAYFFLCSLILNLQSVKLLFASIFVSMSLYWLIIKENMCRIVEWKKTGFAIKFPFS